jgi:hypothetical protein
MSELKEPKNDVSTTSFKNVAVNLNKKFNGVKTVTIDFKQEKNIQIQPMRLKLYESTLQTVIFYFKFREVILQKLKFQTHIHPITKKMTLINLLALQHLKRRWISIRLRTIF